MADLDIGKRINELCDNLENALSELLSDDPDALDINVDLYHEQIQPAMADLREVFSNVDDSIVSSASIFLQENSDNIKDLPEDRLASLCNAFTTCSEDSSFFSVLRDTVDDAISNCSATGDFDKITDYVKNLVDDLRSCDFNDVLTDDCKSIISDATDILSGHLDSLPEDEKQKIIDSDAGKDLFSYSTNEDGSIDKDTIKAVSGMTFDQDGSLTDKFGFTFDGDLIKKFDFANSVEPSDEIKDFCLLLNDLYKGEDGFVFLDQYDRDNLADVLKIKSFGLEIPEHCKESMAKYGAALQRLYNVDIQDKEKVSDAIEKFLDKDEDTAQKATNDDAEKASSESGFEKASYEWENADENANNDFKDQTDNGKQNANNDFSNNTSQTSKDSYSKRAADAEQHGISIVWEKTGNEKIDKFIEKRNDYINRDSLFPTYRRRFGYNYNTMRAVFLARREKIPINGKVPSVHDCMVAFQTFCNTNLIEAAVLEVVFAISDLFSALDNEEDSVDNDNKNDKDAASADDIDKNSDKAEADNEEDPDKTEADEEDDPDKADADEEDDPDKADADEEDDPDKADADDEENPDKADTDEEDPDKAAADDEEDPDKAAADDEEDPDKAAADDEEDPDKVEADDEDDPDKAAADDEEDPDKVEADDEDDSDKADSDNEDENQDSDADNEKEHDKSTTDPENERRNGGDIDSSLEPQPDTVAHAPSDIQDPDDPDEDDLQNTPSKEVNVDDPENGQEMEPDFSDDPSMADETSFNEQEPDIQEADAISGTMEDMDIGDSPGYDDIELQDVDFSEIDPSDYEDNEVDGIAEAVAAYAEEPDVDFSDFLDMPITVNGDEMSIEEAYNNEAISNEDIADAIVDSISSNAEDIMGNDDIMEAYSDMLNDVSDMCGNSFMETVCDKMEPFSSVDDVVDDAFNSISDDMAVPDYVLDAEPDFDAFDLADMEFSILDNIDNDNIIADGVEAGMHDFGQDQISDDSLDGVDAAAILQDQSDFSNDDVNSPATQDDSFNQMPDYDSDTSAFDMVQNSTVNASDDYSSYEPESFDYGMDSQNSYNNDFNNNYSNDYDNDWNSGDSVD